MMKQVIQSSPKPPTNLIETNNVTSEEIVIARGKDDYKGSFWHLRYEDIECGKGWIFRYWFNSSGMCGHFETIQEAIEHAFKYADVFTFDRMKEAADFVKS